jgi:hypothetical protein
MQRAAAMFLRADGTMRYGLFPSVYDGDVYGLEEDYAFYGLALWGHGALARAAFRATYLNDAHLSKRHYLHDLRNGLTPWQALRLGRLAGMDDAARWLDPCEQALVRACGEWVRAERRREISGAVPGLLPPFRYGGDLDFPTQSLFANAANWSGMRALADLFPQDAAAWRAEADEYRRVLLDAFDAARTTDPRTGLAHYPLHTGAGEPGDYYQLMLCGILETYEFFAPGDPRLAAMHAYVEGTGRLFFGLPRFDGWGTDGFGIDAHYAVGYLLDCLRGGAREKFWTGLCGLVAAALDPRAGTFREVGPALLPGAPLPLPAHLPGRNLGLTEPCIGGPGVLLQLVRHALLSEALDAEGRPGRTVHVLPAPLPSWWAAADARGDYHLAAAPTNGGPVTLCVENRLAARAEIAVDVEAPDVEALEVHAPEPPGWTLAPGDDLDNGGGSGSGGGGNDGGASRTRLPAGKHRLRWRYTRRAAATAGGR